MTLSLGRVVVGGTIPVGNWRDGLCDCFRLGTFHPHVWMAWCCLPIALGQVMTRLNLDWFGNSMEQHPSSYPAFKFLLFSCIIWLCLDTALQLMAPTYSLQGATDSSNYVISAIRQGIAMAYGLFILILMIRVRSLVRSKYAISEQICTGCDDCCTSFWCHCCVVAHIV
jgi:Cys-rich protein (TIGR01571 family)